MHISVDTNFIGGAAENIHFLSNNTIAFTAPQDGSTSQRSLWFYFRVTGAKGIGLTFVQENMAHVLGIDETKSYTLARPVIREGKDGKWDRLPAKAVYFTARPHRACFHAIPKSDETYIAFCYPYFYYDFIKFTQRHKEDEISLKIIGESAEGRPFPMLLMGSPDEGKELLVCTCRHHAAETPGSYVLEGLCDAFLSESPAGLYIRQRAIIAVFPFVDIDGVHSGRYGKDTSPIDFNRDWTENPRHVEIRMILKEINKLRQKFTYKGFFDFHAPQPGAFSYIVPLRRSISGDLKSKKVSELASRFAAKSQNFAACRPEDLDDNHLNWGQENYQSVATAFNTLEFGVPAVTLETSYHMDCENRILTPELYHQMGASYLEAIAETYFDMPGAEYRKLSYRDFEITWADWEMVTIPKNITWQESANSLILKSLEYDNEIWVTHKKIIEPTTESSRYMLQAKGSARIRIYVYFYPRGKNTPFGRSKAVNMFVEECEIPFFCSEAAPLLDLQLRYSIKVEKLDGELVISHY